MPNVVFVNRIANFFAILQLLHKILPALLLRNMVIGRLRAHLEQALRRAEHLVGAPQRATQQVS